MKNKKTAYFLLPVVLAVWGMIGWKVYAAFGEKKMSSVTAQPSFDKVITIKSGDTIPLIANYRDPFLDKVTENTISKNPVKNPKSQKAEQPVSIPQAEKWPSLVYHGLIKKSGSEKMVGFLTVNNKSFFVHGNEDAGIVSIGKVWKDSIEIFFAKEKQTIHK